MVGMPLLNLGYGLSGLTQGYNQAQQQAMQLAAQRLALQQAQSQQNAQRLASQYLQSGGFKGFGGMFGGGFNPANINPISQPAATGGATPSQAPAPPSQQQPPPANGSVGGDSSTYDQWWNNNLLGGAPWSGKVVDWERAENSPPNTSPDAAPTKFGSPYYSGPLQGPGQDGDSDQPAGFSPTGRPYYTPGTDGQTDTPSDKPATSSPPVTTAPDTKPAPTSADDSPSSTAPSTAPATTSDASSSGGQMGITIGNQTIPLSDFFSSVDYGQMAQGIAKIAPPGTDQADIYQAVVDLSKLAEGNKTQQQQAGLILRELIGHPFKMEEIGARGQIQTSIAAAHDTAAQKRAETAATSRETVGAGHDATRLQVAQLQQQTQTLNRDAAQARFLANQKRLTKNHQDQLDHQFAVLQNTAAQLGYREISLRMSAIRGEVSTIKGTAGTFSQAEQDHLAKLDAEFAALAAKIQPSPAAPQAAPAAQ